MVPGFRSHNSRQIVQLNLIAINLLIDKPCRHQQPSDIRLELPPAGSAPVSWQPCLALRRPHRVSRVAGTSCKRAPPVSESPSDLLHPCSPAGLARCTCAHTTDCNTQSCWIGFMVLGVGFAQTHGLLPLLLTAIFYSQVNK